MIFRAFGANDKLAGLMFVGDDLSLVEAEAISNYFAASRRIESAPACERASYQHYASVQFAAFYSEGMCDAN